MSFSLVLNIFELLQHERDESTEKYGQRNHGREIDTKKRTLVLQAYFEKTPGKSIALTCKRTKRHVKYIDIEICIEMNYIVTWAR